MRVIAGSLKGRRLEGPEWGGLRPTSDRLRETLFAILAPRVPGARVLDGYAGTGALGIEAVSRGARSAAFVDDDPRAARLIARNVARCGIAERCVIIRGAVARALESMRGRPGFEPFDIVLLDPPYALAGPAVRPPRRRAAERRGGLDDILCAAGGVLAPGGLVVLEHARRVAPPETAGALVRVRTVASGDSALSFYEPRVSSRS